MDLLDEPTRLVLEEYKRRFGSEPRVSVADLGIRQRSRLIAALERALERNIPLLDFEAQEFEVTRRRRLWLGFRRAAGWMASR